MRGPDAALVDVGLPKLRFASKWCPSWEEEIGTGDLQQKSGKILRRLWNGHKRKPAKMAEFVGKLWIGGRGKFREIRESKIAGITVALWVPIVKTKQVS